MNEVIEGIVRFLIRWLAFHIIDNDKRMAFVIQHIKEGKSLEEAKSISDKKMNGSIRLLIDTVLTMYDSLSSRSLDLMREKHKRHNAEQKLNKTNLQLRKINTKLKELAITDQLTGLFNRRHFNSVFTRELKRAYRNKSDLSLIILDIDFFKKLNDHHGHSEGDRVLTQVSKKIKSFCKRPTDYAFRLGGEEFGILSASQDPQGLSDFAEIIRKGIEDLKIANTASDISDVLTVSIGTVTKVPNETDTVDDYMFIADMRL
ncbi:MAG: diguanylate cyclase, partial [Nitrosomonas sp.]|nr:diguanylate cyclase [Nitrosomonas sp.]